MSLPPSAGPSPNGRVALALMLIGLVLVALALPPDAMARLLGLAGVRPVGGSPLTSVPKDGVLVLSVRICRAAACDERDDRVDRLEIGLQASSAAHACPAAASCYQVAYILYLGNTQFSSASNPFSISSASSTVAPFTFTQFTQSSYTNVSVTILLARST